MKITITKNRYRRWVVTCPRLFRLREAITLHMTRHPTSIRPFSVETLSVQLAADGSVVFDGTLSLRDPNQVFGPHIKQLHKSVMAEGLKELTVDVTKLGYVNSSCLLIFLDWARWIEAEPAHQRYTLRFITRPGIAWQQLLFPTMQRICSGHVKVEVLAPSGRTRTA